MALALNYTDERTVNYPTSYWRIVRASENKERKTFSFQLQGYKDAATATAEKTNDAIESVGEKSILVKGPAYTTAAAAIVLKTTNHYEVGYAAAKADTFFASATDV